MTDTVFRTSSPMPIRIDSVQTHDAGPSPHQRLRARLKKVCAELPGAVSVETIWAGIERDDAQFARVSALNDSALAAHVAVYSQAYLGAAVKRDRAPSEETAPRADVVRATTPRSATPDPVAAAKAKGLSFPVDPSMRPPSDDGRADALEAIESIGDPVARAEARARYEQENAWRG